MDEFIFLYGPPGSGKTAVGRCLAESLSLPFYDLDDLIQKKVNQSIASIFDQSGETGFRAVEKETLTALLEQSPGIVALGGGSLLDPANATLVKEHGDIFLLLATPGKLLERLSNDPNPRPLLARNLETHLNQLLEKREAHYRAFENRLDNTHQTARECADACQILLGRYRVLNAGEGYDVRVTPGGLLKIGSYLQQLGHTGMVTVISDENVGPLYAGEVIQSLEDSGFTSAYVQIPAGEKSKNLKTVEMLWQQFLRAGMARDSLVAALGGGVVGDIAGFAAATFLRGVPWIILPTTLLAMADASLGGKTGIDLEQGKNLVGAFYPPKLVLSDPSVLKTLPDIELRSGMAEIIKHGIIADPYLFSLCERMDVTRLAQDVDPHWVDIIRRAVGVKVKIIEEDPLEKGIRAVLNLGHTIGHALEVTSQYKLNHGQAVAIGLVIEAQLAKELGLTTPSTIRRISTALQNIGLPVEVPEYLDMQAVIEAVRFDKKKRAGSVRFVLPVSIGEVKHGIEIKNLRRMHAFNLGHTRS